MQAGAGAHAHELELVELELGQLRGGGESMVQIRQRHAVHARDAIKLSSNVILRRRLRVRVSACDVRAMAAPVARGVVEGVEGSVLSAVTSLEASDSTGNLGAPLHTVGILEAG